MYSARERYLYEADWHRRRAQILQTAAIVQACLGDEEGARKNLASLVDELFPENGKKNETTDTRLNEALESWKDRKLPVIPSFHAPEGMELLPKIDLGGLTDIPTRPAKKPWGKPEDDDA